MFSWSRKLRGEPAPGADEAATPGNRRSKQGAGQTVASTPPATAPPPAKSKTPEQIKAEARARQLKKEKAWREEWQAAHDLAVANLRMPEEKVRIYQDPETGWWHVERPKREVYPARFEDTREYYTAYLIPRFGLSEIEPMKKPDMEVHAEIIWHRYEPKFTTYAEAEEWAKVTVLLGGQPVGLKKDGKPTSASLALVQSMLESQAQEAQDRAKQVVRTKDYEADAQF